MSRSAMVPLLAGLVDYAGLFPPAALPMEAAVANYARYRTDSTREMLARFVVPVARLAEFASVASDARRPGDATPWPLAVLAGAADAAALDAFDAAQAGRFAIDTIEAKAERAEDVSAIAAALRPRRRVYVELPAREDPDALIAALVPQGLCAKIRTGGVVAEAFPTPAEVLRFLAACLRHRVPFKATAGLHHPLRGEYALTYAPDAPRGTMYGYLNVFMAAALLHAGHAAADVAPVLEECEAGAFTVHDGSLAWRGRVLTPAQLHAARAEFAGSFGSCSFTEPVDDLAALSLLPYAR